MEDIGQRHRAARRRRRGRRSRRPTGPPTSASSRSSPSGARPTRPPPSSSVTSASGAGRARGGVRRHRPQGHRADRGDHRRLRPARRRAAAVRARRGRALPGAAHGRLPLGRGTGQGDLGYLLSVAASFGAVVAVFEYGWFADRLNVEPAGAGALVPADHPHGRALRAGHGLRGLPRLPDARGLGPPRRRPAGDHLASPRAPASWPRPRSSWSASSRPSSPTATPR